jgi:hypothetical protein
VRVCNSANGRLLGVKDCDPGESINVPMGKRNTDGVLVKAQHVGMAQQRRLFADQEGELQESRVNLPMMVIFLIRGDQLGNYMYEV